METTNLRLPWTGGDTPNIAIGQGYNLLTPVQMVSLYAAIANGAKCGDPSGAAGVNSFGAPKKYLNQSWCVEVLNRIA